MALGSGMMFLNAYKGYFWMVEFQVIFLNLLYYSYFPAFLDL